MNYQRSRKMNSVSLSAFKVTSPLKTMLLLDFNRSSSRWMMREEKDVLNSLRLSASEQEWIPWILQFSQYIRLPDWRWKLQGYRKLPKFVQRTNFVCTFSSYSVFTSLYDIWMMQTYALCTRFLRKIALVTINFSHRKTVDIFL